jgi:peptidoglycan/xylan/chitin deacetylase (PgdA/CDA1 family)
MRFLLLFFFISHSLIAQYTWVHGGIIRGDSTQKKIALAFTAHDHGEGADFIINALKGKKASFFLTGEYYRNNPDVVNAIKSEGHYLGAHSDQHLLYCAWEKRDSTLISRQEFTKDVLANLAEVKKLGIESAPYYMPPYEWYNAEISEWAKDIGLQIVNFTPGTLSNADYTTPSMKNYRSSEEIMKSILQLENKRGLNGFILLIHMGTHPDRKDKFYYHLPKLFESLKEYEWVRIDELLKKGP